MLTDSDLILIEKKLRNRCDPEETNLFEQKLTDPDFQQEWEFQKDLSVSSTLYAREKHLQRWKKYDDSSGKLRGLWINPRKFAYAASFLLLIVSGFFLNRYFNPGPKQLYKQYYSSYPPTWSGPTRSEGEMSKEDLAFSYYSIGEYELAIDLFEDLKDSLGNKAQIRFFLGVASMETREYSRAIASFKEVITAESLLFSEAAEWHLALSYLVTDKKEESISLLEKIIQTNGHEYKEKASRLLSKLST